MATWEPKTVVDVVQQIDDKIYVLPVIQRSLVWQEGKMELLFDSLLKGNSFGGIMVLKEERDHSPLFASRPFTRTGEQLESELVESYGQRKFLVIDGQQRLQSFYIGLKGSFNSKRLYFNLLSDSIEYEFRFAGDPGSSELLQWETTDRGEKADKVWYAVDELFDQLRVTGRPTPVTEEIIRKLDISNPDSAESVRHNINEFYLSIFGDRAIGFSTVTVNRNESKLEQERQRIVELFRRLNDGGTRLSTLDLVASIFKGFDHRMEKFFRKMEEFEDIGIEQDEIINLIFLLKDNHNKVVTQVTAEDTEFAIQNQERILQALRGTRSFLRHAKLYNYYHSGSRSDIPLYFIAYHIFHKSGPTESLDRVYENFDANNPDFVRVKRWIYLSLLNGVFSRGCGWIPYRTGIRKILNVLKLYKDQLFPVNEIFLAYSSHPLRFSEEISAARVESWDRDFLFYVIYGHETISNRDVDHIHPKSKLNEVKKHDERITDALIHSTANFQLLDPGTNRDEKRAKILSEWIQTGVTDKGSYLKRHLIPDDNTLWSIERVPEFLEQRAQAIAACVAENIPQRPDDPSVPQAAPDMNETDEKPDLATVQWLDLVPESQNDHPILKDETLWRDIFYGSTMGPRWASRYTRELSRMNVHSIADLVAAIMVLRLTFAESQTHGNAYRFYDTLADGSRPELRKRHFGGFAWSSVLDLLEKRGFAWHAFLVE